VYEYTCIYIQTLGVYTKTLFEHANTCIHVCVCVCVYVYVNYYIYVERHGMCIRAYKCMHTCFFFVHVCMGIYMYDYMHVKGHCGCIQKQCVCIQIYVYISGFVRVCMCVHLYIYV